MNRDKETEVLALFEDGFVGSVSQAANHLAMAKPTVYKHMRALSQRGQISLLRREATKGGGTDVFALTAATPDAFLCVARAESIVARAIATRHPLQLWASGSLPA